MENIISKLNLIKITDTSIHYCIISSLLKYGKIEKAKEIIELMYNKRYPITNRLIDPLLTYFYKKDDTYGYEFIEWLFNYIIAYNVLVKSNLIIKFIIYLKNTMFQFHRKH